MFVSKAPLKGPPGFSLIEVSIVLMIVGLMTSTLFPLLRTLSSQQKRQKTTHHQQVIMKSLAGYVLQNGYLPRASDPRQNRGNAGKNPRGIVPYRELGLSEKYARDGYGRYMTYVVWVPSLPSAGFKDHLSSTELQSQARAKLKRFCRQRPKRKLKLVDRDGVSVLSQAPNDSLAILLISHGQNGHGAYRQTGGQIKNPNPSSGEIRNAAASGDYVVGSGKRFDHVVEWSTNRNLISTFSQENCPLDDPPPPSPLDLDEDPL